jgi:hypothetical protein
MIAAAAANHSATIVLRRVCPFVGFDLFARVLFFRLITSPSGRARSR